MLASESVHCVVTSPPYFGLRNYGEAGQIGLEPAPEEYITKLVAVFREVGRVLRNDGTLWLNMGDSYARDAGKGQHKPGDAGKQNYIVERGGGRASSTMHLESESRGSSDGGVGRADRAAVRNGGSGLRAKDLIGIPWMLAFALRADGWRLRQDIIWAKPNPMPESVKDRCTKAHEYLFLLSKSERYYFDAAAIAEDVTSSRKLTTWEERKAAGEPMRRGDPGQSGHVTRTATLSSKKRRNKRSVWTIAPKPFKQAHFATFPPALITPCVLAGAPAGGVVLDPFFGAGTTGLVAEQHGRSWIGIELNPVYAEMAMTRIEKAHG